MFSGCSVWVRMSCGQFVGEGNVKATKQRLQGHRHVEKSLENILGII